MRNTLCSLSPLRTDPKRRCCCRYSSITLGLDGVQRETISKDSCYSTTQVMERYCSGTTSAFTYQNCLYECSSGVCTDRVKPGDWFILGVPGEIFEYKGADKNTANSPKIKFHKKGEGVTLEYAIPTNGYVKIKVQGMQFNVKIINPAIADSPIQIDYDGDGILDTLPLNDMIYYNQNSLQAMLKQDCATNSKSLVPGETTTLNVGAVTYEVTLNEIVLGSNSIDAIAKFTVNGENLPQLLSGSKVTLVDGINSLKVKEVLLQSYAGGVKSATFCLEI